MNTSWTLLKRLKNPDDNDSWQAFCELYAPVVIDVAKKSGLRDDEAQVAFQETLASISRNINKFEADPGRGSFHAWL
ncbi:MAG TPA: hypothetical protein VHE81_22090, partial [Lacipirellulaceae bacterium]|nr:hypothetical protein [Lacipirellulaceae bacterium]